MIVMYIQVKSVFICFSEIKCEKTLRLFAAKIIGRIVAQLMLMIYTRKLPYSMFVTLVC